MNTVFDPKKGRWEMNWPERISRHDLVYLSPPTDPAQGLPIGNGDLGALCWCEGSKIILALNKCDLWDDAQSGRFHNWRAEEEEFSTTLRHAGRLIIDFGLPIFDVFYLSHFEGRLSLSDASLSMTVSGPFGSLSFKAYVSHQDGVLCCEMERNFNEKLPVEITVERFGSRTFSHWYALVNRNAELGLAGTESCADGDGAYIRHRLTSGTFALGCSVVDDGGGSVAMGVTHSHASRITLSGMDEKKCSVMVAVTSPMTDDPIAAVRCKLAHAKERGYAGLFEAHQESWKAFWQRSLMESGDDYLDNLWHLTMYYANASQRGKYPGRFINGLWGWNRDVQNWNFYFHWNQQQTYWPLNAAGHHDLMDSYLDFRFDSLAHAKEDARELFGSDGAFVSDVCDRHGYNSMSESHNHTPVAQIAMDFWRQYEYTGDRSFLESRVLPYLLEAAYFFESLFEKGEDGNFHAKEGTGYEGWIKLRDGITELVYARVLFSTAVKALEEAGINEPRAEKWKGILDHLTPIPVMKAEETCIQKDGSGFVLGRGMFRGEGAYSDRVLAAGYGIEERDWLASKIPSDEHRIPSTEVDELLRVLESSHFPYSSIREDMKVNDGIFPFVENAAVFPSGLIGLSQQNMELYGAAVDTAKLFAPDCMGWDPVPIVLARLGRAREMRQIIENWPVRWQCCCNGFGHYGPRDVMKSDGALRFRTTMVKDASLPEGQREKEPFPFPAEPFRHMGMESMSVLACALNESLLQSHDRILRIAPAALDTQDARFTLHAVGGFVVSAEIREGSPAWIFVESLHGNPCTMENPWPKAHLYRAGQLALSTVEKQVTFQTEPGERLMMVPEQGFFGQWETKPATYERNEAPKTDATGRVTLGLARMF
ncbi:MAG: hypothetical protein V1800_04975 [Candidatus Latescibacterota bacterium]